MATFVGLDGRYVALGRKISDSLSHLISQVLPIKHYCIVLGRLTGNGEVTELKCSLTLVEKRVKEVLCCIISNES